MLTRSALTTLVLLAAPSAQADTIYSYPFGPFHGDDPAVEMANDAHPVVRFLALCVEFGLECSVPDVDTADAENRLDGFLQAWDDYMQDLMPEMAQPRAFPFAQLFGNALPDVDWPRNPFSGDPFPTTPFGQQDLPMLPRIEIPENGLPELPRPVFPWIPL